MTQSQVAPTDLLQERIQNDIDHDIVVTDASEIPVYTSDVYGRGIPPALVVRPTELQQVSSVVHIATSMGFAITQRGGGMSYTGGYLPTQTHTVMLDLSALNRIVSINEDDLVITVEAGVTWQQIWETLTPRGLRLPFFGTFSNGRDSDVYPRADALARCAGDFGWTQCHGSRERRHPRRAGHPQ